jgi:16S rRNA (cytidine1402-2'-O)-methyltransferase
MAAIAASGLDTHEFAFLGFPPSRPSDRKKWLAVAAAQPRLVVFFEAPHRILGMLTDLAAIVGGDAVVGLARELTKTHEELVVRPISEMITRFVEPRGEFTVLLPPRPPDGSAAGAVDPEVIAAEFGELTKTKGRKRREALKILADRHGMAVNALYKLLG